MKVAIAGIATWLLFWLITPVYPTIDVDRGALVYIAFCYLGLIFGAAAYYAMTGRSERRLAPFEWRLPFQSRVFWFTLALGLGGMALRLVDRIYLRGAEYGANALEFRESLEQSGAGALSVAASALFPLCFIPLIVLLASRFRARQVPLYVIAAILFVLPAVESLAQLSRSVALTTIVLGFSAFVILRMRGRIMNAKLAVTTAIGIVVFSLGSTFVFANRIGLMDMQLVDSVVISVYADNLQPNPEALSALLSGSSLLSQYYSVILPNGMYYISGLFEFSNLWTRPDEQIFAYGAYNATAYVRAAQIIFDPGSPPWFDEAALVGKFGVFQTFFGGAWIDFGYLGPLFLIVLGYVAAWLGVEAKSGNFGALPIYLYVIVIIFFMPVSDFINQGLGNFVIASFVIFASIYWRRTGSGMANPAGGRYRPAAGAIPGPEPVR